MTVEYKDSKRITALSTDRTVVQGFDGGYGTASSGGGSGGGGGGSSAVGENAGSGGSNGNGGAGTTNDISGSSVCYAGGGGGSTAHSGGNGGATCGGGQAGTSSSAGVNGTANTGGGGGGGGNDTGTNYQGGAGGSGIVILRFTTSGNTYSQSGGTVDTSTVSGQTIISYTSTSGTKTFTPSSTFNIRYLVVAGGGAGGNRQHGGGGGAGGYRASNSYTVTPQTYNIVVGAGGTAPSGTGNTNGTNGSDSSFGTITSVGGGRGGTYNSDGLSGGSGGGSGGNTGGSGSEGNGTTSDLKPTNVQDNSLFVEKDTARRYWFSITPANGYDVANISSDSKSSSGSSQSTLMLGLGFNADGTKAYRVGYSVRSIFQYSLSTAWDISTASYDSVSFSLPSPIAVPYGIEWNGDGTKFVVCDSSTGDLYQFSLSTAYDISTTNSTPTTYDPSETTSPDAIKFNSDGTKAFVIGQGNDTVYRYSLSTAYDISTMSYDSNSFTYPSGYYGTGLEFNSDGTEMYLQDHVGNSLRRYTLSTAYDLSTASLTSSFSTSSQFSSQTTSSLTFSTDGTKLYIGGYGANDQQYSTGTAEARTWINEFGVSDGLMFGGISTASYADYSDSQSWNGVSWTAGGSLTGARQNGASAGTGSTSARYVNGFNASPAPYPNSNRNESYNGTSWTSDTVHPDSVNNKIHGGCGTADSMLVSGGHKNGTGDINNYYKWTGSWTSITASGVSGAVSTSGTLNSALLTKTTSARTWNGTSWSTSTATSTSRTTASKSGISSSSGIRLFDWANTNPFNSTSEIWNGTSWSASGNTPSGRTDAGDIDVSTESMMTLGGQESWGGTTHTTTVYELRKGVFTTGASFSNSRRACGGAGS